MWSTSSEGRSGKLRVGRCVGVFESARMRSRQLVLACLYSNAFKLSTDFEPRHRRRRLTLAPLSSLWRQPSMVWIAQT